MPLADPRGHSLDLVAVGDVADLVLGVELRCELGQPLFASREQYELPAAARKRAADCRADPARAAGDNGDAVSGRA
jgi:hypothetical protein